jgi:hypothetical protein
MAVLALLAAVNGRLPHAVAQDVPGANEELSIEQARLADRFERLDTVLGRLAELSASTDPRRAKLLREAIAKSREQDINTRFETIVSLLEDERLSAAAGRQTDLRQELDELLELLLKADRDRELESEHRRIKKYLQEVAKLIRLQKGINARTEGGDDTPRLAQDQGKVAEETGKLGDDINATEGGASGKDGDEGAESEAGESDSKPNDSSKPGDADGKSEGKPGDGGKPGESKPADGAPAEGGESSPSESGSPNDSPPSSGQGQGQGQPGQPGESGESQEQDEQPQQPGNRAAERLKSAQERMQDAQKKLDDAERKGAAEDQRKALKELEQAKAELERILRQLREEEMERTLTLLAARFRKMLEAQLKVYDGTVRLAKVPTAERDHDEEIEAARLSREESLIVREADRALVLLREEGSSVAFPETVSLMREDMQRVTERLADVKVGTITQDLEQDIIEALEETIAALEMAIKDLEKKKTPPGQSPPAGQPTEPPLVEKLAELKMIRSLQMRINRRTQRYGKMIEGEQAETAELLEALGNLAQRQQRVYQATSDLAQGRND